MSRVPDYFVEASRAGVVDDPRVTKAQLDELRADDAAILARHPARAFLSEVERRSRAHGLLGGTAASVSESEDARGRGLGASIARRLVGPGRARFALGALGCATLAAVALTVTLSSHAPEESVDSSLVHVNAVDRAKGATRPQLEMHRVVDGKIETLANGDEARAGDVIQLDIVASEARHAVVVSLDGRGEVTLHFPEDAAASTSIAPHTIFALAHSFQLDDAPNFERFFLVTSENEIDPRLVFDAAKRLRDHADTAPLDVNFAQRSLLLRKVRP